MEGATGTGPKLATEEVVLMISSTQESSDSKSYSSFEPGSNSFAKNVQGGSPNAPVTELKSTEMPRLMTRPSPEISKLSPQLTKPPRPPPARSAYSKPKSRLLEPSYPSSKNLVQDTAQRLPAGASSPYRYSPVMGSPSNISTATTPRDNAKTAPITPKTPLVSSFKEEDDDDDEYDEQVYKAANPRGDEKPGRKFKAVIIVEWIAFVCVMAVFITSLTIPKLRHCKGWSLEIWKWSVLVLVIFCGHLVTDWLCDIVVFFIERSFLLKKKVLYFVYGLRKSVRVFIWLGLILLAWGLLINHGVRRSRRTKRILNYITRALACSLIGAAMWMMKTLFVKLLASSFHVKAFFDRIQESFFHQYVLQTLSGPPLMQYDGGIDSAKTSGRLSFKHLKKGKKEEDIIDVDKLYKMRREKVSAWTMGGLIKVIRNTGLSTLSDELESINDEGVGQTEITSEWEAKAAALRIFTNVAKPNSKYIDEGDLLRFMTKEEVDNVLPLFQGGADIKKIKRSSLRKWVVDVYNERKYLAHSLKDAKTAIEELNKIASGVVLVIIIIVWLLLMGIATTKVLVFISSQVLLVVFMFGNTCKTVFEAIIFVFVMHPFDVGDRCVVDGVQMVVEEMNILTTIFLRYDNEKISYPNSVLATKAISNYNRSPEMGDSVEFAIDVSTSIENITALREKIKEYLESKPQHWRSAHSVQFKEIENVNKMKVALYVTHTINFQNIGERGNRRSDLILELKKILERLSIKYHLLPQEVRISFTGSAGLFPR